MKTNFSFSNLLGTVYKKGNISFSKKNVLLAPVGNKVSYYDLKNNIGQTFPFASVYNITHIALSPNAAILIVIDENGEGYLCSTLTGAVIAKHYFHSPITALSYSPNGRYFAVAKNNIVLVYHSPGLEREFNQFLLHKVYFGPSDSVTTIDWTSDSKVFVAGSKDCTSRVFAVDAFANLVVYTLGGHSSPIVGAFFECDSLDVYSVCEGGVVCHWRCDSQIGHLRPKSDRRSSVDDKDDDSDFVGMESCDEAVVICVDDGAEGEPKLKRMKKKQRAEEEAIEENSRCISYRRQNKFFYMEINTESRIKARVSSVDYHRSVNLLVTGFVDGCFILHIMPDFTPMHALNISDVPITTISINPAGSWIALGTSERGQLVVYEWQTQLFIRKTESHFNDTNCFAYSPDGSLIASGGHDSKIKLWQMSTGSCFQTFKDHSAPVTAIAFPKLKPHVLVSASLDGTVRVFDLHRYRNFRTLTIPRTSQFSCVTVDSRGDLAAAGCMTNFQAHVWSIQTSNLLVSLSGHSGPISGVCFSPGVSSLQLATSSWDGTLRFWDFMESRDAKDVIPVNSDGLCIAYRPDGMQVAMALLNSHILFFNTQTSEQEFSIEGHHDLGVSKPEGEKISAKKASESKCFQCICYSSDGKFLLAGGNSKFICLYSICDQLLVKRFEVTCNLSLDGVQEMYDRRKMSEWGSVLLIDEGQGDKMGKSIGLPGVKYGDKSRRHWRPEVRISCVEFAPTGDSFAVTSTEGLLVYSLHSDKIFDPSGVDEGITPNSIYSLHSDDIHGQALEMALKLNEKVIIQKVVEGIPIKKCKSLK